MTNIAATSLASDPQQAWQMVLEQLKMDMPKASFDTWVSETRPMSYEDGLLTVGARNAYARDWLENRLSSTVSHLLIGIMNRTVDVEFVVSTLEQDELDTNEADEAAGKNEINLANATRYEEEVKPHRVIVIPGYALRMLGQGDLSAKEMSLWVAFRQAVYFDWKKAQTPTITKNIPHQAITRFANMSRASYFRAINGVDELAGGLIRRLPAEAGTGFNPHLDNAIRWQVAMSPHLTRHDATVIEMILSADLDLVGETTASKRMAAALQSLKDMTSRHPSEYLDDTPVTSKKSAATSVTAIVRRALGLEGDLPATLFGAAEALQNRLMSAFGSVVIPHHFLTTSAPFFGLTQSQMWTVIVLRDRVFYDYEHGTEYDFVMAKRGLESISDWTGVSVKSLKRWFEQDEFQAFVHLSQVEIPAEEQGEGAERLRAFLGSGGAVITVQKTEPPLGFIQDGDAHLPVWTKRALTLDKVSNGAGQSEHRPRTKRAPGLDKVSTDFGQSEHPLNNLFKPLLTPFKPQDPHPTRGRSPKRPAAGGLGSHQYWDFDFLMRANAVNPGTVQNFRKRLKKGLPISKLSTLFVSWLLYAHSPAAGQVQDPVSIAIRRVRQNPHAGIPDFDRLATLKPFELKAFFDADFAGKEPEENENDLCFALYREHFAPLKNDDKRRLYHRLFGGQNG